MPWTRTTRDYYRRDQCRFASDMTDAEWSQLEPLLPAPRRLGRPRKRSLRQIVGAIFYMSWTGIQWRALPREFPPFTTVQSYFYAWRNSGLLQQILAVQVRHARRLLGRADAPTAAVIDSQSVPTAHGGPRGFDAGKRVRGRKRHIVTDTNGLLLAIDVHPASIQDCHGAAPLLRRLKQAYPSLRRVYADRVYRGQQLRDAIASAAPLSIDIVERPKGVKGFQLLPRRWVVERTIAWFGSSRRLTRDYERSAESQAAWAILAHVRLINRRLAKTHQTHL